VRSALLAGTGLALSIGVFLGWTTRRAARSWTDWRKAKEAVPVAKKAAYANARSAALNWFLITAIVIILIAATALACSGDPG
jgi:hypothetical protein